MTIAEGSVAEDLYAHANRKPSASQISHTTAAWSVHAVKRQTAVREVESSSSRPDQHLGS